MNPENILSHILNSSAVQTSRNIFFKIYFNVILVSTSVYILSSRPFLFFSLKFISYLHLCAEFITRTCILVFTLFCVVYAVFFVLFCLRIFIIICFVCTIIRSTATERQVNCSQ